MTEMYAFIAAFSVQILILSVLTPLVVVGVLRTQIARFIADRAPPVDAAAIARVDRSLRLYRTLGLGAAVVGVLLLGGMIRYMLRPDWTDGPLEALLPVYFLIQVAPLYLALFVAGRFHEVLRRSLPVAKRKAQLEPRGLFDFVPRSAIALAALAYGLFFVLLLYVERHPFPGFAGVLTNIVGVTLVYVMMGIAVYVLISRRSSTPLQDQAQRLNSTRLAAKVCVYSCIAVVLSISINMALILLDLQRWEPSAGSLSFVVFGLVSLGAALAQLRIPAADDAMTGAG